MGENGRPGDESRELGLDKMDEVGGRVERGLARGEGGKVSSTLGIMS